MQSIQTALIGFGFGGRIFHAPFITSTKGFDLRYMLTSNPKNIALANQQYPTVQIKSDFQGILTDDSIQLIVLALPNRFHYSYAKQALEAGKHVVVEKPFTITTAEANELIALAQKKGLTLTVFHNRRWDSDFLTIKHVLEKGYLGKLVEYEAHFDRFRNYIKPNAWKEKPEKGSGILYDLGSHLIDQALNLFGMPQAVFADLRSQRAHSDVIDNFELLLYYNDLKVTLKASMLVNHPLPKYLLFGREGTFVKHGKDPQEAALIAGLHPEQEAHWGKEDKKDWGFINSTVEGKPLTGTIESLAGNYGLFYENLYDSLSGKAQLAIHPEEARDVITIIEMAQKSHDEKKVIKHPSH